MNKLRIFLVIGLILFATSAFAKNVKVEALSDFTTANPPENWSVKLISNFVTDDEVNIPENSILNGVIINVKNPKRLKRNAKFSFSVTEYTSPDSAETIKLNRNIVGKYSPLTDVTAKSIARRGAIAAGNKMLNIYIGPSAALVKGAVKNEDGNVVKSAIKSAYQSSPFSYIEKGKDIVIEKGTAFVMNFKVEEERESVLEEEETEVVSIDDADKN